MPQFKHNVENIKDNEKHTKIIKELNPKNWPQLQAGLLQTGENVAPQTRTQKHAW